MERTFLDLNWAATVINTLLVAFFVLAAGGIFIGVYSALTLGKREKAAAGTGDVKKSEGVKKTRAEKKAEKATKKAEVTPKAPKPAASTPKAPAAPKDEKKD